MTPAGTASVSVWAMTDAHDDDELAAIVARAELTGA